jgi:Ca2+-binding RTX toxin-like protein
VPPTTSLKAALVWVLVVVGAPVLLAAPAAEASAERCTIVGTAGDDVLIGTPADDVICGLRGDDKIRGRGGDDVLRGGGGDDVVRGGPGDDRVAGGRGDDRTFGQGGHDVVRGDAGDDEVVGGPGNDRLGGFRGADDLDGTDDARFVDFLRCGPGPDTAAGDPDDEVKADCETVAQNDPPSDIFLVPSSIPENEPAGTLIGALTAADPDPGDSHTFTLVAGDGSADNAKVAVDGAALRSAASYDFETDDQLAIRVKATDEAGTSVERALTVTVTDVGENPPVATDDAFETPEDTDLVLPVSGAGSPTANDTDADGDPLTVTAVAGATGGSVSIVSDEVRFVPAGDLCGDDVAGFDYTVSDGTGLADQGHVVVDVTCVDDAPVAVDDSATVDEDSGATAVAVLGNDSDADADPFTIASASDPANGTVVLTGGGP